MKAKKNTNKKIATYLVLAIFLIFALFPMYWMINTSLKGNAEIYNMIPSFWPKKLVLTSYIKLLFNMKFLVNIKNSLIVSLIVSVVSVFISMFAAYGIVNLQFRGKKAISTGIIYAYLMPRILLFIPLYIFVSFLGLNNSLYGLLLIYPTMTIPYATWMLISYFKSIPKEIGEASMVDGCSRMGSLFRIIFPLASPGIVSTLVFSFTLCWSEFLYALVIITKGTDKTIPLALSNMIVGDVFAWGPLMGGSIIASIPVVIIYILASRFLVSGMTMGGVKQ